MGSSAICTYIIHIVDRLGQKRSTLLSNAMDPVKKFTGVLVGKQTLLLQKCIQKILWQWHIHFINAITVSKTWPLLPKLPPKPSA